MAAMGVLRPGPEVPPIESGIVGSGRGAGMAPADLLPLPVVALPPGLLEEEESGRKKLPSAGGLVPAGAEGGGGEGGVAGEGVGADVGWAGASGAGLLSDTLASGALASSGLLSVGLASIGLIFEGSLSCDLLSDNGMAIISDGDGEGVLVSAGLLPAPGERSCLGAGVVEPAGAELAAPTSGGEPVVVRGGELVDGWDGGGGGGGGGDEVDLGVLSRSPSSPFPPPDGAGGAVVFAGVPEVGTTLWADPLVDPLVAEGFDAFTVGTDELVAGFESVEDAFPDEPDDGPVPPLDGRPTVPTRRGGEDFPDD